jgi:hypothetical protein
MILLTREEFYSKHFTCRPPFPAKGMVRGYLTAATQEILTENVWKLLSAEYEVVWSRTNIPMFCKNELLSSSLIILLLLLTYLLTPWSRVLLEKLTSELCS